MDAKQFLAEFRHIISAPGGVQRIRELVLQLAISGDLTSRIVGDTVASDLLAANKEELGQLITQGYIKNQHPPKRMMEGDYPWLLPDGWLWCRLGEATSYGYSLKAEREDVDDQTWVLELEDIERGTSRLVRRVRAYERKFKSTKNRFDKGAVLYTKLRPYLDKVLIADEEGVCTTEIVPISFFGQIEPSYLRWYLKSPFFLAYAANSTHGMNLPRLGTDTARNAPFPFPPAQEQKHIVAKVDELMALCDKLEAQQKERETLRKQNLIAVLDALTVAHGPDEFLQAWLRFQNNKSWLLLERDDIEELRRAIFVLAVTGKLKATSQGLATEYMADLVAGFKPAEVSTELAELIPKNWCWAYFEQVANIRPNLTSPFLHQTLAHIAPNNIERGTGRLLPYRTAAEDGVTSDKHHFYPGQILYSKIRPNLNKLCLVDFEGLCSADIYPIEARIDVEFLVLVMLSSIFVRQATSEANRVAMPKINQTVLNKIVVPIPPLEEQQSIVKKVFQLQAILDELEQQLDAARNTASLMALTAITQITGIQFEGKEKMKAPKTELVSILRIRVSPTNTEQAPLAAILIRNNGELPTKTLWNMSGLEIDAFYQQLKTEMVKGWIVQTEPAYMKEVGAN